MGHSPLESSGLPLFFLVSPAPGGIQPTPRSPGAAAVRVVARSLSVMQKEALIANSSTGAVWRLASDEGPYLLGDDVAPPPLAFMSVGLCSSFAEAFREHTGTSQERVRLVQHTRYTMRGSATQGTLQGGALPVELRFEVEVAAERAAEAVHPSPLHGLVRPRLANRFSLTHNGRRVEVRGVLPAESTPPPRPLQQVRGAPFCGRSRGGPAGRTDPSDGGGHQLPRVQPGREPGPYPASRGRVLGHARWAVARGTPDVQPEGHHLPTHV